MKVRALASNSRRRRHCRLVYVVVVRFFPFHLFLEMTMASRVRKCAWEEGKGEGDDTCVCVCVRCSCGIIERDVKCLCFLALSRILFLVYSTLLIDLCEEISVHTHTIGDG